MALALQGLHDKSPASEAGLGCAGVGRLRQPLGRFQIGQWNMTADRMARRRGLPWRHITSAKRAQTAWASPLKRTALFGWRQFYHIIGSQGGCRVGIRFKNRAQKHLGIRVRGQRINIAGWTNFAQAPLIQHRHPV